MEKKVKYTCKEINDVAKRMHSKYKIVFANRCVPRLAIRSLTKKLEEYPITEEQRLFVLEYAARIKYEIMHNVDYIYYDRSKDPTYFEYKKKDFAPLTAISYINGNDENEELPELIKDCISKAYNDSVTHIENNQSKKLVLSPSLNR